MNRVDSCLLEGRGLSDDLDTLINPKMIRATPTATESNPTAFGLTINQMATQPQSTYPFCNEQSVRAGADQVRSQVECLVRDKGLLQEQVRLVQSRIDRTGDLSQYAFVIIPFGQPFRRFLKHRLSSLQLQSSMGRSDGVDTKSQRSLDRLECSNTQEYLDTVSTSEKARDFRD